jgi:hypothetical protein
VTPELPVRDAVALLADRREPRLIVLDPDGTMLLGLLCANRDATRFCIH